MRVVAVNGTGAPAFGARGTVIGVMPTVVELLMEEEYAGEWVDEWGSSAESTSVCE